MKKLVSLLISASMLLSLAGCGDEDESKTANAGSASEASDPANGISARVRRDEEVAMGDEGTYTIFVYMCGSDLESENGMATNDLQEMIESSANDNARFVVETGGASAWQNDYVSPDELDRFVISNGNMELVDKQDNANMGDSSTLSDFLDWGVKNYSASKMGLIFWDHGGGSLNGVCVDENFDSDTLSLREIDAGLMSVYMDMSDQFEFIGFDACLMGTLETAGLLSVHSRYMIGSEETEPGYGWNYTQIGNAVAGDPSIDGAALGQVICDGFYEMCTEIGQESKSTLSVIDLSKANDVINAYNDYESDLWDDVNDNEKYARIIRNIMDSDNYGGNNQSEGFANMVDIAGVVNAGAEYSDSAQDVLSAIDEAVVYTKNGNIHSNACGLSTYFPFGISDGSEITSFSDVCVSLHYLGLVDKFIYGAVNSGDYSGYDPDRIVGNEEYINYFNKEDYDYDEDSGKYSFTEEDDENWSDIAVERSGDSPLITFAVEPELDDKGSYHFKLDENGLENCSGIEAGIYGLSDDGKDLICYGSSNILNGDWDTGEFSDNFDGSWFSLPDGQILTVYLTNETDKSTIYSSPVMVNGKKTNLQIEHMDDSNEVKIVGTWAGIDLETGSSDRVAEPLKKGDKIIPIHETTPAEGEGSGTVNGNEFVFDGEPQVMWGMLPEATYFYGFIINDIYGDYKTTDPVPYVLSEDGITFYDDLDTKK